MRIIHISMTSKFQCEYCQCFTFKRYDKFKLKCTSHGGTVKGHKYSSLSEKMREIFTLVVHIVNRKT